MVLAMSRPHKDRRGVYWLRRKVPAELRPIIGRTEYKRSLSTRDPEEAARRFPAAYQESVERFALARAQLAGNSLLNAADVEQLASRWFTEEHAKMRRSGAFTDYLLECRGESGSDAEDGEGVASYWDSMRSVFSDLTEAAIADVVLPFVEAALSAHSLPMPPAGTPLRSQLLEAFRDKLLLLSDWAYAQADAQGRYIAAPPVAPREPLSVEQARKQEQDAAANRPISEVLKAWAEAKRLDDGDDRSTAKTIAEFETVIGRFIELHGDMPVTSITRATCQEFRASLAKIPTSGKGIRSLSVAQAIARGEAEGLPLPGIATVRKQLKVLSTVLHFARERLGLIQEEPVSASGLLRTLAKSVKKSETRSQDEKGYSRKELQRIFSSPLFRGQWSPPRADYGQALYWLPLLMAYTGARREEMAQLLVSDVCYDEEADCWYLDIRPGAGKTLKTYSSFRKVPLHPDLLALGFIDYRNSLPADGRLFPKLTLHPVDGYGHAIGKTWSGYLDDVVGLETAASPSHGFRHSFKTLCRDVGIDERLADWLTGHAPANVGATYGHYPMRRMYEEVQRLPSLARLAGLLED